MQSNWLCIINCIQGEQPTSTYVKLQLRTARHVCNSKSSRGGGNRITANSALSLGRKVFSNYSRHRRRHGNQRCSGAGRGSAVYLGSQRGIRSTQIRQTHAPHLHGSRRQAETCAHQNATPRHSWHESTARVTHAEARPTRQGHVLDLKDTVALLSSFISVNL